MKSIGGSNAAAASIQIALKSLKLLSFAENRVNSAKVVASAGAHSLPGFRAVRIWDSALVGYFDFGVISAAISSSASSIFTAACGSSELVPGHVS